jgi:hypothetical protein
MNERREGASLDTDRDRAVGALIEGATGHAACQNFVESDKPGHYAIFKRCLTGWPAFENAASSIEPQWFKDLLPLWRPSGQCSGAAGLRIAIRNGYLNFYRLGQSIARVGCVSGELRADVHYKYVLREPRPGMSKPSSSNACIETRSSSQGQQDRSGGMEDPDQARGDLSLVGILTQIALPKFAA